MALLIVIALDVEARQAQNRHEGIERRYEKIQPGMQHIVLFQHDLSQERRSHPKSNRIRKGVELGPQVAKGIGHARHATIEAVEQHCPQDEPAGGLKKAGETLVAAQHERIDGLGNRQQAKKGVTEGQEIGEGLGASHGRNLWVGSAEGRYPRGLGGRGPCPMITLSPGHPTKGTLPKPAILTSGGRTRTH